MFADIIMDLLPRAVHWNWDVFLILLNSASDMITLGCCVIAAVLSAYVYRHGKLSGSSITYPQLWIWGAVFVLFLGISRLGSMSEIWLGGVFYYITAVSKIAMSIAAVCFTVKFWKARWDLVLIGRVIKAARDIEEEEKTLAQGVGGGL